MATFKDLELDFQPPPGYNDVFMTDVWKLIIPRLPKDTLTILSKLRNKHLANLVQEHIWSNPRAFWPQDLDDLFRTLSTFVNTVGSCQKLQDKTGRLSPARFTTILDLSGICYESFSDKLPQPWLHDLLYAMPNLRFLSLSGSSVLEPIHFTHVARAVHSQLAILDLSRCKYLVTSMVESIPNWAPNIWYLDLSENDGVQFSRMSTYPKYPRYSDSTDFFTRFARLRVLSLQKSSEMGLSVHRFPPFDLKQGICALDLRDPKLLLPPGFNPYDPFITTKAPPLSLRARVVPDLAFNFSSCLHGVFGEYLPLMETGILMETRINMSCTKEIQKERLVGGLDMLAQQRILSPGWWIGPSYGGLREVHLDGHWTNLEGFAKIISRFPLTAFDCGDIVIPNQDIDGSYRDACVSLLKGIENCPSLQRLRCPHGVLTGGILQGGSMIEDERETLLRLYGIDISTMIAPFIRYPHILSVPELSLTNFPYMEGSGLAQTSIKILLYMAAQWENICATYLKCRSKQLANSSDCWYYDFGTSSLGPVRRCRGGDSDMQPYASRLVGKMRQQLRLGQFTGEAWDVRSFQSQNLCLRQLTLELAPIEEEDRGHVFSFFKNDVNRGSPFRMDEDAPDASNTRHVSLSSLSETDSISSMPDLRQLHRKALETLQRSCRSHSYRTSVRNGNEKESKEGYDPLQSHLEHLVGVETGTLTHWKGEVFAIAQIREDSGM